VSSGRGSAIQLDFRTSALANIYPRDRYDYELHADVRLTGRTRSARNGHGHVRKSYLAWEYECSCGHIGWSSHREMERRAISMGMIAPDDARIKR
jgi:hypothetical protein